MMTLDWRHGSGAYPPHGPAAMAWLGLRPECFDLQVACDTLAPLCPPDCRPHTARLLNVWYLPPHRLMLVYELHTGHGRPVVVTVAVDDGPAAADETPGNDPGTVLPTWRARAWRLPDDPAGLPIARLLDPDYTTCHVGSASARPYPAPGPASAATMLSYLPGKRLVLRVPDPSGDGRLVLKHQLGAARSHAAMTTLWRHPGRRFEMAEPVAVDQAADVRWERFLTGTRIEAAAAAQGWESTLRSFLPSLVALHGSPLPGLPVQPRQAVLARLKGKVTRRVAATLPELHDPLLDLCARLSTQLSGPVEVHATLHGDLHTGNLLATSPTTFAFIDLDSLTVGEPAYDLALLGSRLLLVALMDQADPRQVEQVAARLGQWYEQAGGAPGSAQAYAWHLATLLPARQLRTCIRHAAPRLPTLAQALLRQANRIVDAGEVPADLLTR